MSIGEIPDPDDPIEYYINHRKKIGRDPGTITADRAALKDFRQFIRGKELKLGEVTPEVCSQFLDWLDYERGIAERTVLEKGAKVNLFYEFYNNRSYYEANPMRIALENDTRKRRKSRKVPEVSIGEMRDIVYNIKHPMTLAIVFLLVKTGIRRAEVYNIDLRDVHIDDSRLDDELLAPRAEIADKPNSLFIPKDITRGQKYNGEVRERGNKRERDTIIPIDDELKQVLTYWLSVRPPSNSVARPLLTTTEAQGPGQMFGDRIRYANVYARVKQVAEREGLWHSPGKKGDRSTANIDVHFFRHFFTTHMRNRVDDNLVKFIRGDVGSDVMDIYTHRWGNKVESEYREGIYKLF